MGLLQGPTGGMFLMSEVPLYFVCIPLAGNIKDEWYNANR